MSMDGPPEDGRGRADGQPRVRIDRRDPLQKWRYTCPNGHANWDRTNSHIWCPECRRANEAGADVEVEHYELLDKKRGETIPWSTVEVRD